jgi:DNA-directed RNA polymerase subunit K/omega
MPDLPHGVDSSFRHILIAAKRAEQLIDGARARVSTRHVKPTTIALDELSAGSVPWRRVTAEEFEAMKQQELLAQEREEQTPLFPVPLPTLPVPPEPELEAEEEEFEEELEDAEFDEELSEVEEGEEPVPEDLLGDALPE